MTEIILIAGAVIFVFVVILKIATKKREDFARKFARVFTHIYRSNEEGFSVALSARFDKGRTFAEKTIEDVFDDNISPEEIREIIDISFKDQELALDNLVIHTFAKMTAVSHGKPIQTITEGLFRDKHEEVLNGIKAADAELKRGHVPQEAKDILKQASTRRITKLMKRELGSLSE